MYPTAAKIVAALLFAGLAWGVSDLAVVNLPEGTATRLLRPVNAAIGFMAGWRLVGAPAGRGYVMALGQGLTAALVMAICAVIAWAAYEMIQRSMDLYYGSPTQALEGMVALVGDFASYMLPGPVIPTLVIGGFICGLVAEWVANRAS